MLLKAVSSKAASCNGPCLKARSDVVRCEEFVHSSRFVGLSVKYITWTIPRDDLVYTTTKGDASNRKNGSCSVSAPVYLIRSVWSAEANHRFRRAPPSGVRCLTKPSTSSLTSRDFISVIADLTRT